MKKLLPIVIVVVMGFLGQNWVSDDFVDTQAVGEGRTSFGPTDDNTQVLGHGIVVKVLPDDNEGSRHQRFILRLSSGQTVLVAHNIDLAPRVAALGEGDRVGFYGEFEWNDKGGVVHWTHRASRGSHPHGWLQHSGQRYD